MSEEYWNFRTTALFCKNRHISLQSMAKVKVELYSKVPPGDLLQVTCVFKPLFFS
jgi:hypothetical protein